MMNQKQNRAAWAVLIGAVAAAAVMAAWAGAPVPVVPPPVPAQLGPAVQGQAWAVEWLQRNSQYIDALNASLVEYDRWHWRGLVVVLATGPIVGGLAWWSSRRG